MHILFKAHPNSEISKFINAYKSASSRLLKKEFPQICQKLCQEVIRGNVEMIVIENKDRLMRFGYEMFEKFFRYFGTKILVLNDEISNKSYEQELTDDLISIIHYFSMKSYSHRRKLNKLRKELEVEKKEHL